MRTVLTIVAAALASAWAGMVLGQDPMRLRVDVQLVALDVEVTDSSGRPVTNLARDDFQIFENGTPQQLASFDSVETPYHTLLLFDCSGSTEGDWAFLVQAMNRFVQMVRSQDRVAVAEFGGSFKVIHPWFSRPSSSSVLLSVQPRESVCVGTDLYGAIRRGIEETQPVKTRKGIVILTDGQHNAIPYHKRGNSPGFSRYVDAVDDNDFQKLVKTVAAAPVVLYFVAVDTDLNPDRAKGGIQGAAGSYNPDQIFNKQQVRSRLEQLALASGGRVVFPENPGDVVHLYEQMARELGSLYSLGYAPSDTHKDGTFRKIEVRVRDRSLRVRQSRDGYTAR